MALGGRMGAKPKITGTRWSGHTGEEQNCVFTNASVCGLARGPGAKINSLPSLWVARARRLEVPGGQVGLPASGANFPGSWRGDPLWHHGLSQQLCGRYSPSSAPKYPRGALLASWWIQIK